MKITYLSELLLFKGAIIFYKKTNYYIINRTPPSSETL